MGSRLTLALTTALLASTAHPAPPSTPVDLIGTWKGEQVCDIFFGRPVENRYKADTMYVSRDGDRMRMRATCQGGALPGDFETCQVDYVGFLMPAFKNPEHKSEATFNACRTDEGAYYNETLRFDRIEFTEGRDVDVDGISLYSLYIVPDSRGRVTGTCTWKYHRVSTEDPQVPPCRANAGSAANSATTSTPAASATAKYPR